MISSILKSSTIFSMLYDCVILLLCLVTCMTITCDIILHSSPKSKLKKVKIKIKNKINEK